MRTISLTKSTSASHKLLYFKIILAVLLIAFPKVAKSQDGPLTPTGFIHRSEVMLIYDEIYQGKTATINEQGLKLRKDYEAADLKESLSAREKSSRAYGSYDNRHIDAIGGDFNGDETAEYIYTSTGKNDSLRVTLVSVDSALQPEVRVDYKINGTSVPGKNLVWGDVNGDHLAEFALAYKEFGTGMIKIGIFTISENFQIMPLDIIDDIAVKDLLTMDFGDFDGDNNDELVVEFHSDVPSENHYMKVYDFDSNSKILPKNLTPLNLPQNSHGNCTATLIATDYDGDNKDEIVMAFGRNESDNPNNDDTYLYTCDVSDDNATPGVDMLEKINIYSQQGISDRLSHGECSVLLLKSGDLNGDGKKDIILATSNGIRVYDVLANNLLEDQFDLSRAGSHEDAADNAPNFLEIADMTGDGKDEVIMADNFRSLEPDGTQYFTLNVYQYDSVFGEKHISYLTNFEKIDQNITLGTGGAYGRHYAIVAADFDGEIFRLGEYTNYSCWQNVVTPVSVLNTPPVHIDYMNGSVRDISSCFGQNTCESSIQKLESNSNASSFSIKASHSGDWGYVPKVDYFGLDIGKIFGGDLEQVNTTNTSISESKETFIFQTSSMDEHRSSDDAILTTVCNYQKWEYPLYGRNNTFLGNIIVVKTDVDKNEKWINGKDIMDVSGLLQLHEQGNLLSYRKFYDDTVSLKKIVPDIRQIISIASDHTLDNNSSFEESISWSKNFENSYASKTNTMEINPSTGVDFYGIHYFDLHDESTAEDETIETQKFEVGESFGLKLQGNDLLGDIYTYSVRPYYYWSTNGALVVDYMVDLSQGSFWKDNFSIQDPGFLFPNRLDSLKVKSDESKITDMDEYIKTPSVYLDPTVPNVKDTVIITALIHNLSLTPTSSPVSVQFYLGDPTRGGTLLHDVNGNSLFSTQDIIGDQNYTRVKMKWVANFSPGDRIYCMIDPDNNLDENREDNNLGWTPVQRFAPGCSVISGIENHLYPSSVDDYRFKIYPNPAKSVIYFSYSGPSFYEGKISLVDMNGVTLKTIPVPNVAALSSLNIITGGLHSGSYLVILTTKNYVQHSRLVIY